MITAESGGGQSPPYRLRTGGAPLPSRGTPGRLEQAADAVGVIGPLGRLALQELPPLSGQVVPLAVASAGVIPPAGDRSALFEPVQDWIKRAGLQAHHIA